MRSLQSKVTHSFINLSFVDAATKAERYDINRRLKETMAASGDTRHLKVVIEGKASDQSRRMAMGQFYSWCRTNGLDAAGCKSQWGFTGVDMFHSPVKGKIGTLLGRWLGENAGWEASVEDWRRVYGDKIPTSLDGAAIARGLRGD